MQLGQDAQFIKNLFGSIAGTYDKANDAITFGMAHRWRESLVKMSGANAQSSVLDCATGTGDLAFDFERLGAQQVYGIDFTPQMIELAQKKNDSRKKQIQFAVGDVLHLEFADNTFDVTSIAYGIRNVADVKAAITEMARVTKSGGSVMVLETGEIENPVMRWGIRFYFERLVPRIGGYISKRRDAYEYLQRSSGEFISGQKFSKLLLDLGLFSRVEHRSLMGGASFIYKAVKK
jgi:demethylmenaquinone methyltransferase/2-methoxy-6-polyprenyl-1,4-benzoquinol methylase